MNLKIVETNFPLFITFKQITFFTFSSIQGTLCSKYGTVKHKTTEDNQLCIVGQNSLYIGGLDNLKRERLRRFCDRQQDSRGIRFEQKGIVLV